MQEPSRIKNIRFLNTLSKQTAKKEKYKNEEKKKLTGTPLKTPLPHITIKGSHIKLKQIGITPEGGKYKNKVVPA